MLVEGGLAKDLCAVGKLLWQRGLIGASEGNLSIRMGPDRILCTAAGGSKGRLEPDDLSLIDAAGKSLNGVPPSSEILMHLGIYSGRPDCNAVVHAHPPITTAYALAGEETPVSSLPEAMAVLGPVKCLPFAMPGTVEVPNGMEPFLAGHKTFLLGNHGAVTLGKDIWDACERMETLERMAVVSLAARLIGKPRPLPEEALKILTMKYLHGRLS